MIVSIHTVALNEELFLPKILKDFENQDYDHSKIELILVDSLSTDNTKKIMENFKEKNNDFYNIIIIDNHNKTLAHGQNLALKVSSGDLYIKVDAHAMIPHNFVSENVKTIQGGEDVCGGRRINVINEVNKLSKILLLAEQSMFGSGIAAYRRVEKKTYVKSLAHICLKREVLEKVGLINTKLIRSEDNEFNYRIRKAGYKLCLDENIKSYYQTRSTFKKMIKQKYSNGYWVGVTTKLSPKIFSMYHYVPLLFVCFLMFSIVSILFSIQFNSLFLLLIPLIGISTYLIINIILTIIIMIKNNVFISALILPFLFFLLHFSYGFGTLIGLIVSPFKNLDCEVSL